MILGEYSGFLEIVSLAEKKIIMSFKIGDNDDKDVVNDIKHTYIATKFAVVGQFGFTFIHIHDSSKY